MNELRRHRERLGLTQEGLSEIVGLSVQQISKIERDKVPYSTMFKLAIKCISKDAEIEIKCISKDAEIEILKNIITEYEDEIELLGMKAFKR